MQRFGQVIRINPDRVEEYEAVHRAVWPEVLSTIKACSMRNYSIFRYGDLLFAYFEYVGDDFAADMARMSADSKTQEWWAICGPMQVPVPERAQDEWWHTLNEVFHTD
ncbi:L-rhamnose mutarotase [soil metagenome]